MEEPSRLQGHRESEITEQLTHTHTHTHGSQRAWLGPAACRGPELCSPSHRLSVPWYRLAEHNSAAPGTVGGGRGVGLEADTTAEPQAQRVSRGTSEAEIQTAQPT